MRFTESQQVEKWLDGFGVEYEVNTVPFNKINRRQSRKNMARLDSPLIEEHVSKLMSAVETDACFPAFICAENSHGEYILLDGNHRDEANLRNGSSDPLCYIVKTDDAALIDAITRCANRDLNGEPQSREEALEHAMHLVRKHKMSAKQACELTRVSVSALQNNMRANEIRTELAPYTDAVGKVGKNILNAVSSLTGIANVAAAVVDAAATHKLTGTQTKALVAAIDALPKEEDTRLEAVHDYVKDHFKSLRRRASPKDKHVKAGNKLRTLLESLQMHLRKYPDCSANAITGIDDKAVVRRMCDDSIELLLKLEVSAK